MALGLGTSGRDGRKSSTVASVLVLDDTNDNFAKSLLFYRYQDGGRLSDQQMALLQYQQENIHFLSEEVCGY